MNKFFARHYHWVILGLALLVAVITAAFLIPKSIGFAETFGELAKYTKTTAPALQTKSTNAIAAKELLSNPTAWKTRPDGASPLVSRPYILKDGKLIDPMEGNEPLYPPVPNQWLIDHQLDYTDVNILERDPKHKGFTVLEEYNAGTDPNNPAQFPPLSTKLGYADSDIKKKTYLLEFIGQEDGETRKEFMLKPAIPLENPAKGNRPDTSARGVIKGETVPGADFLKVVDYQEKKKTINDTEYDVNELVLENTITGERYVLVQKNTSREYSKKPIEIVESVTFHYQLSGVPQEDISVERGKPFSLTSLDKKHTENYKLVNFSNEGILLEKEGKTYTVKPLSAPAH